MLKTPSMATTAPRYGPASREDAVERLGVAVGERCETFAPLAPAIFAPSWIELWACSSTTSRSLRPTRAGIAPMLASVTDG